MKVLFAPDSFKGTIGSVAAATVLAEGWASVRGGDDLVPMPQADGGEGTLDVLATCTAGSQWSQPLRVRGPDGRPVAARWLELPDGPTVLELAESSGIALMEALDPLAAGTRGLGEVIAATNARKLSIALGGSASTDGGLGALRALGLRVLDANGADVPEGGAGLICASSLDASQLATVPEFVELLTDTAAVLCGPNGAAQVFGPQKGASPHHIVVLDEALQRWAGLLAREGLVADPGMPGVGAAGGTAFGLCAWGAVISPGAGRVSSLTGLAQTIPAADLVVTGEGQFDRTSSSGKLVGHVLDLCRKNRVEAVVVAGRVDGESEVDTIALGDLAGSAEASMREPARWLFEAGRRLASSI